MNVFRIRLSLQEKREVLVAAGQLALIAADGAAQSAISCLAVLVVPYEHRIVVICRLKEQLVIQAITDNNRVNSSALQVFLHAVRCFGQLRHQQFRVFSFLLAIENGRLFCLPSENDLCCLRERDALHLDEIVQRRSAANAL